MKGIEYEVFKEVISETMERFGMDEFMIVCTEKKENGKDVFHYSNADLTKNTIVKNISVATMRILIFANSLNTKKP